MCEVTYETYGFAIELFCHSIVILLVCWRSSTVLPFCDSIILPEKLYCSAILVTSHKLAFFLHFHHFEQSSDGRIVFLNVLVIITNQRYCMGRKAFPWIHFKHIIITFKLPRDRTVLVNKNFHITNVVVYQ